MSDETIGSITRAFHREDVEILGHYMPGGQTVVFNPLQTGNPAPVATLVHENAHRHLTRNSYHGVFLQGLALFARRGAYREQFEMALDASRATQEGIATWVELAMLADLDPAAYHDSLLHLPRDYRRWLDAIRDVIPIEPGAGSQDNKSALVLSLGLAAHANELLLHDVSRWQDPAALAAYLQDESPDRRLERILATIAGSEVLHDCLDRLQSLPADDSETGRRERLNVIHDLYAEYDLAPLHSSAEGKDLMQRFAARCDTTAAAAGLRLSFAEIVPDAFFADAAPEIRYVDDWAERYPHAVIGEGLTTGELRWRVQHAARNGLGLVFALAMYKPSHVHVGTQFYVVAGDGRVSSAEESMKLLERLPISQGELPTAEVLAILDDARGLPSTFFFIRESWRVWDSVLASWPKPMRFTPTYECAMEVEITRSGLEALAEFRGVGRSRSFGLFSVSMPHQQYAAVFFDPAKPRKFSLQSVPGELGGSVLLSIVRPWGFEQHGVGELGGDLEIARLMARSFLL